MGGGPTRCVSWSRRQGRHEQQEGGEGDAAKKEHRSYTRGAGAAFGLVMHDAELQAAIAEDKTGEGFIYEMFLYELDNHEYGYTRDTEDTLDALGYTAEEILGDSRLKRGIEKAVTEICGRK